MSVGVYALLATGYFNFKLEPISKQSRFVIVGPCPHPELSESSVANLLMAKGADMDTKIKSSEIPYRNW